MPEQPTLALRLARRERVALARERVLTAAKLHAHGCAPQTKRYAQLARIVVDRTGPKPCESPSVDDD